PNVVGHWRRDPERLREYRGRNGSCDLARAHAAPGGVRRPLRGAGAKDVRIEIIKQRLDECTAALVVRSARESGDGGAEPTNVDRVTGRRPRRHLKRWLRGH